MAHRGDVDISVVGALLADAGRCRMLFAVNDGRALPASRLAAEAGVSAATASTHLKKLVDAELLSVEPHGRHRYYRLAGPDVARLLETMAQLAPTQPIRSLREHTRARALRDARTCYDHVAGRLGVAIMRSLLTRDLITGGTGTFDPRTARSDRLSSYGRDIDYRLTPAGTDFLANLGVTLPSGRRAIRYCVDWSEQAHHLAGGLGRGLLDRLIDLDWVRRNPNSRAIDITDAGRTGLADTFAFDLS
ncbi:MAG: winged helix-turn-helix domain-containing protein [Solirubrobacteraceae bacterium]